MIKVLIVEDDMNYRYAIRETIPWKENNFEIVGEAIHGLQAVEFLKMHRSDQMKPDIILTDMSMPLMNGVELTKEVQKQYPEIIVIALSAYDDFQFVKKSLKYGAKDYILKQEMSPEGVIEVINEAWSAVQKNREASADTKRLEFDFLQLCENREPQNQESISYFEKLLRKKCYCLILLKDNMQSIAYLSMPMTENDILYNIIDTQGNILILLEISDIVSTARSLEEIKKKTEGVLDSLSGQKSYLCASMAVSNMKSLPQTYEQVIRLQGIHIYQPEKKILLYDDYASRLEKQNRDFIYENTLTVTKEMSNPQKELDRMVTACKEKLPSIEALNTNFVRFIQFEAAKYQNSSFQFDGAFALHELQKRDSIKQKCDWTLQAIEKVKEASANLYLARSHEIQRAIEYIQLNYSKDLSLNLLATYVGLSDNYFSNLFKEEMGENLIHYINKVRIENAKKLLDNSNMKDYEIAEAVGFNNSTYFSTIFRKMTNISISDYRYRK